MSQIRACGSTMCSSFARRGCRHTRYIRTANCETKIEVGRWIADDLRGVKTTDAACDGG